MTILRVWHSAVPFGRAGAGRLHQATAALSQARAAERVLAEEKVRLAAALADMTRLHELSTRLLKENDQVAILHEVLAASIELQHAEKALLQLYDEHDAALTIAAQVGFDDDFLELFKFVPQGFSAYGAALERRERVIVEDALSDERFAALAPVYASHDVAAVQCTPLLGRGGKPIGMLSTHWGRPHRPTDRELRMLDLYAHQAERAIERKQVQAMRNHLLEREHAARASAEHTNRVNDQILATVSHELRTLLNPIVEWADALQTDEPEDARRLADCRAICDSAKRLAGRIDELLDAARIMSGDLRLERSAVDSEAAAPDPVTPPSAPANPTPSLEGISVLVVDDDLENREVVAAYLEGQQAVVLTAASAAQAFEMLQWKQVHVLLADVAMPDEDGYALIRRLRASAASEIASIPAVALSGLDRDEDRQQALEAGFQAHLGKPIDVRSLVEAVARLRRLNQT